MIENSGDIYESITVPEGKKKLIEGRNLSKNILVVYFVVMAFYMCHCFLQNCCNKPPKKES